MSFFAVACSAPRSSMLLTGLNSSFSDMHRSPLFVFPVTISSRSVKRFAAVSSDSVLDPESKNQTRSRRKNKEAVTPIAETENNEKFPTKVPRKSKRGRRSEADAVEDYVRSSLERTFSTIKEQNPEVFENKEKANFIKDRGVDEEEEEEEEMVVEEEDPDWPVDTDVGWGIKASEYFDTHPIKNVVGDDGSEIDWEGEIDDSWVKEINCLEWESFAFHPSPLVVLVFERYKRASDNWKTLKELEKAIKVYWDAKDRLPPRAVKIDLNIETDLAYALKAKECPQILFLRGNRILYREKDFRTADELVHMIAHFYYKAKRPSCVDKANVTPYC
ncbi:unnamed protein product [Arabidopsis thaliana]|uniref:Thioredoxin-like fold domain-containing protein MRL7, chloroplastic n=3 Tax=Arabidopsis TaxID=3701 RepID=MRL7_ARATH|nr:polyadenylate-binding protein 2-binding protein [Arabidopsis thaliana]F4JLC1.1 RecName: Full=Thioredoxin-like fold domain-containing protein MRL7, chloroplastic; AltName: Full=Protein EARLY CHLOROPLAST BIOGENESIS 1; Short=AtECB1; AltName: Full=Protein MESOPHYLL-CELL RNAI LIBRARY LINE 7; Short=AtMRL7; AltName: Full=Protein REGULATOR OF CHLOROPLAST BIOGENESIS; AltName: Full=Protein SUPPRESSOR OF VARIEGATION 4; Flags: Precursor [Arabidopsis thaliana]KAG7622147.1 Thioredoxin-like superfamily [Arab|eukprot:NP_194588.2 polyadenylate-binding protein 2-binding protein [Arabidopsis thaliana]